MTLERVNALLLDGEIAAGRAALRALWRSAPGSPPADLDACVHESLRLSAIHGWRDIGEEILAGVSSIVRSGDAETEAAIATGDDHRLAGEVTLRSARAALEYNGVSRRAAHDFFDWFLPIAARRPALWSPWLVNFRLVVLGNEYDFDRFDELLRNPPVPARRFGRLEAAIRLARLASRLANESLIARAIRVYQAAERLVSSLRPSPSGEFLRGDCLLRRAKLHARENDLLTSNRLLRDAERIGRRLRSAEVLRHVRECRGIALHHDGRFERSAESFLDSCSLCPPDSTRGHGWYSRTQALLLAARSALLAGRLARADRLLSGAEADLDPADCAQLHVLAKIVRCRLEVERGTDDGLRRARQAIEEVDAIIRSRGWSRTVLNLMHVLNRGWLRLAEGNPSRSIHDATLAARLSRERRDTALESESLYLQSALLIVDSPQCSSIYDRTLNRLGVIRDAGLLFKVIANLYLYTWSLDENAIEMTDLHLKQLAGLRESLGDDRFRELYEKHVAHPLTARFRDRILGTG